MPVPRRARLTALGTALALTGGLLLTSLPASADPPDPGGNPAPGVPGRYIVTLTGAPIASYAGEVRGLRATRPSQGRKVNASSAGAKAYRAYLERQQDGVAARVGAEADRHYAVAANAFTANLTPTQAKRLARTPGVLAVTKDLPRTPTDDKNPVDFWRLTGSKGVWENLGGKAEAGRGVVAGIIDSGYWPESPSFAGTALGTTPPGAGADPYAPYQDGTAIKMRKSDGSTFVGFCEPGENPAAKFTGNECNTKVVSARHFSEGYKAATPPAERTDYLASRARDGHGSHVGSTAVGNADVSASINGRSFGRISGVAPAAKMAVYKVCFTSITYPDSTCYTSDSLSAVDQAVADGVDVINYSISGSDDLLDPVDLAFLNAAAAGVFVAASAGNSGPGAATLNHVVPWLTTVAASTVAPYAGTVVLGNGKKYAGISTTVFANVGPRPLVRSARVRRAGVTEAAAAICDANTLDNAKTRGKIVVCDRGVTARVEKSAEVRRAGGVGMVLVNLSDTSRDADTHPVPTVHLNVPEATTVRNYAATAGATATLRRGNLTSTPIVYPQIAGFSSRGPSVGNGGDILKPDIAGPGVATLAAVSPDTADGNLFDFYSGTSMSSPHIAGAAALYFGEKPNWSPMAVKSAMMTTSTRLKKADGSMSTDYYAQGAGNATPTAMFNPGLVVDAGPTDWLSYLAGSGIDVGDAYDPIDPSSYNAPSIAIGRLVGSQTVTRTLTAVRPGLYRATVAVPGVDTKVTPSLLTFTRPGQKKTVKVTLTQRSARLGTASFGSLFLRSSQATVRLPIAVTPGIVEAPDTVRGTGAAGSVSYRVKPGFSGPFPIRARGLDQGDVVQGEITASDLDATDTYAVTVPAGTRVVRYSATADLATADLDLFVYQLVGGEPVLVAQSATGSGDEAVTLLDPEPGRYIVEVAPYADPPGQTSTTYEYRAFVVGPDLPNLSVSPANPTVRFNTPFTLTASWSGLDPAKAYLGFIEYKDGTGTYVEIN